MKKDNRLINSFLKQLYDCQDITLLFGLAKILKVSPIYNNEPNKEPTIKEFDTFSAEIINAFERQSRGRRREIVKIFKAANAEVKANGSYDINDIPVISKHMDAAEIDAEIPQGDDKIGHSAKNS